MNGRPVEVDPRPTKPGLRRYRRLRTEMASGNTRATERLKLLARGKFSRGWPAKTVARKMGLELATVQGWLRTEADMTPRLMRKVG